MAAPPDSNYELILPAARSAGEPGEWASLDAAPGASPDRKYPLGTVFVGQTTPEEPSPTVTEWDLATRALVRSTSLPLPATLANVAIARASDALHVVVARAPRGPIVYARLSTELGIEAVEPLGTGEPARIASDGSTVAMLWSGSRKNSPDETGLQLVVRRADGLSTAVCLAATTSSASLAGDPLVVADGRVFVLLPDGASLRVVRTNAEGRIERVYILPWSPDDARLFSSASRVFFTDDSGYVELWPVDRTADGLAPIPGRPPARSRSSRAFRVASNERGELVTAQGDVLSTALSPRALVRRPERAAVLRPLWLFDAPALLSIRPSTGRPLLTWSPPWFDADAVQEGTALCAPSSTARLPTPVADPELQNGAHACQ